MLLFCFWENMKVKPWKLFFFLQKLFSGCSAVATLTLRIHYAFTKFSLIYLSLIFIYLFKYFRAFGSTSFICISATRLKIKSKIDYTLNELARLAVWNLTSLRNKEQHARPHVHFSSQCPVPDSHNSGEFWRSRLFACRKDKAKVSFGSQIEVLRLRTEAVQIIGNFLRWNSFIWRQNFTAQFVALLGKWKNAKKISVLGDMIYKNMFIRRFFNNLKKSTSAQQQF